VMADDITELKVMIARVEANQEMVLSLMKTHLEDDKATHTDFELRLRSLEKTKWRAHGIAAAVGALAAYVVGIIKQGGP